MKTLKLFLKPITYLLAFLILFQGCTVYKSANVTLDEAVKANTNVKIETKDNQTIKLKRIEFEDGQYFGIKEQSKPYNELSESGLVIRKKRMVLTKIPLELNDLEEIKIKDKTMSTIVPIAIPLVVIGGVLGIIVLNDPYLN